MITGRQTVITAAHCVFDSFKANQVADPSEIGVLAGTADIQTPSGTAKSSLVSAISFDPQYDPNAGTHDVAVLSLASPLWSGLTPPPLNGTSPIAPIPLVSDTDTTFDDALAARDTAVVTGWGDTNAHPVDGSGPVSLGYQLQRASVPLIPNDECQGFYNAVGLTIDPNFLFCAGNQDEGSGITDSCQGDSGGPLVLDTQPVPNPPDDYVLAGLVDFGVGCAVPNLPGVYTRLANSALQDFLASNPPPAPQQTSTTSISGGPQPGQTLTCSPGDWTGGPTFTAQFFRDGGGLLATGSTYTIQETDRGTRIYCQVKALNAGGYGYGTSGFVSVPPAVPTQPPAARDAVAPTLRVTSKRCTRTSCTIRLQVRDASPSSGIKTVRASLRWREKVACKRRSKSSLAARVCTRSKKRTLRARAGSSGRFTITATRLKPGTHYDFVLSAVDKAGNVQKRATRTSVRTKRPARRRS